MIGHSDPSAVLNEVVWTDAELVKISIDYCDFSLTIKEVTARTKRVVCEGYVGYAMEGFWDEVVIAKAEIQPRGEFSDGCVESIRRRLGPTPLPSGSDARNRGSVVELIIHFGDDSRLIVAMNGMRVEASAY